MEPDFESTFSPRTVAVIGVSASIPFHHANIIYNKNYYSCDCEAYAVNPKGGELERRRVYRSIAELPVRADMAVVAVRAQAVPAVARECAEAGVRSMVVISGGFAEMGAAGRELQDSLVDICEGASITLVGPNCFGVYSPPVVDTFFLSPERTALPRKGDIAVASQSGAFLVDQIMTNFHKAGVGLSVAVSMGNKAFVDEKALLLHFAGRMKIITLADKDVPRAKGAHERRGGPGRDSREAVLCVHRAVSRDIPARRLGLGAGSRQEDHHPRLPGGGAFWREGARRPPPVLSRGDMVDVRTLEDRGGPAARPVLPQGAGAASP